MEDREKIELHLRVTFTSAAADVDYSKDFEVVKQICKLLLGGLECLPKETQLMQVHFWVGNCTVRQVMGANLSQSSFSSQEALNVII